MLAPTLSVTKILQSLLVVTRQETGYQFRSTRVSSLYAERSHQGCVFALKIHDCANLTVEQDKIQSRKVAREKGAKKLQIDSRLLPPTLRLLPSERAYEFQSDVKKM